MNCSTIENILRARSFFVMLTTRPLVKMGGITSVIAWRLHQQFLPLLSADFFLVQYQEVDYYLIMWQMALPIAINLKASAAITMSRLAYELCKAIHIFNLKDKNRYDILKMQRKKVIICDE